MGAYEGPDSVAQSARPPGRRSRSPVAPAGQLWVRCARTVNATQGARAPFAHTITRAMAAERAAESGDIAYFKVHARGDLILLLCFLALVTHCFSMISLHMSALFIPATRLRVISDAWEARLHRERREKCQISASFSSPLLPLPSSPPAPRRSRPKTSPAC